jgi:CRP-like cAMP-binding protein
MSFEKILKNVSKHIELNEEERRYFTSLLSVKELARKKLLLQQSQPCTSIYFVEQGVLRAYYADKDGHQNIVMFALNDWWITDMYAFANEQNAMLDIDALEDCTLLQLQKRDMDQLMNTVPKFEKYFRILMQNAYIREQLRIIQNLSMPAKDRYKNFLQKYPQFVQHVPLKQIASYLGITPEFLSVLRKKESRKIS